MLIPLQYRPNHYPRNIAGGIGLVYPKLEDTAFPIKKGRKGAEVVRVQVYLNMALRKKGEKLIAVDGSWGPGTDKAFLKVFPSVAAQGTSPAVNKDLYILFAKAVQGSTKADWNNSKYTPVNLGGNYQGSYEDGSIYTPKQDAPAAGGEAPENAAAALTSAPDISGVMPYIYIGAAGLLLPSFITDAQGNQDARVKTAGNLIGFASLGYAAYTLISGGGLLMGGASGKNAALSYPLDAYAVEAETVQQLMDHTLMTEGMKEDVVKEITTFVKTASDWLYLSKAYGTKTVGGYVSTLVPRGLKGNLKQVLGDSQIFKINAHLQTLGIPNAI